MQSEEGLWPREEWAKENQITVPNQEALQNLNFHKNFEIFQVSLGRKIFQLELLGLK